MSNTPHLDPLLIPCLEWRRRAFEFSLRFEKWLRIPPSERISFADEREELSRDYVTLSSLSSKLAYEFSNRSWRLRIDTSPIERYINLLRRAYAERDYATEGILLELVTELTDYYVEDVLGSLPPGPMTAVPQPQGSIAEEVGMAGSKKSSRISGDVFKPAPSRRRATLKTRSRGWRPEISRGLKRKLHLKAGLQQKSAQQKRHSRRFDALGSPPTPSGMFSPGFSAPPRRSGFAAYTESTLGSQKRAEPGASRAPTEPSLSSASGKDHPKTLAELATIVRREKPKLVAVARLLDLMDSYPEFDFETLKHKIHQTTVDDDAVKKNITKTRQMMRKYELQFELRVSDRHLSRREKAK
jgi:hypothetical protein